MKLVLSLLALAAATTLAFGAEAQGERAAKTGGREEVIGANIEVKGKFTVTTNAVSSTNILGIASATITAGGGKVYHLKLSNLTQIRADLLELNGQHVAVMGEVARDIDGSLWVKIEGAVQKQTAKATHDEKKADKRWTSERHTTGNRHTENNVRQGD